MPVGGRRRGQDELEPARPTTKSGGVSRHARAMFIGVLQFTMAIPHAESLKDKRAVVRALKDRARREFNVAIAETDDLDDCANATFGATMVSNDIAYLNGALDKLIDWLEDFRDARLEEHELEILRPK